MEKPRVVTSVATEPLADTYIKNYLKQDSPSTNELALIQSIKKAARELCEPIANRAFARQTLLVTFDRGDFYENKIVLPRGPVYNISSVKAYDVEGTETELTLNTNYYKYGTDFPELEIGACSTTVPVGLVSGYVRYKVQYITGYTDEDPYKLPELYMIAMGKLASEWYHQRHDWIPVMTSQVREMIQNYSG